MSKKFIWLSIVVLSLIFGQASFACSPDNKSTHCTCYKQSNNAVKKLNLTKDQKVKIHALKVVAYKSFKANSQKMKSIRSEIQGLITSDKMDEAKLDALIAQRNQIKSSMIKNRILMQHQIYALLNQDQKVQYKEITKKIALAKK